MQDTWDREIWGELGELGGVKEGDEEI